MDRHVLQAEQSASFTAATVGDMVTCPLLSNAMNEALCSACKTCLSICPYQAIVFNTDKNVAVVNDALCKGCGTCTAACPAAAITARHFSDEQIVAQIEGLLREPKIAEGARP